MEAMNENMSERDTVKHSYQWEARSIKDSLDESADSATDTVKANNPFRK